jgi:hypothetical protein
VLFCSTHGNDKNGIGISEWAISNSESLSVSAAIAAVQLS